MQKITPNLWFGGNAKEAVEYCMSTFPNSKIISTQCYPNSAEESLADFQMNMAGKELVIEFSLNGQRFMAINVGPEFHFSKAISFAVTCKDQAEIDYFWEKLSAVPEAEQCGWCKDKYGLSWQIISEHMGEQMQRSNAYQHMMQMHKLVIAGF